MKRGKASTKMTTVDNSVVHSGWMTKSPPEGKLTTPFKIFRSQWKKRFFVLRKPSGSLPDQYELHYFKDERCSHKKGSIDLEQCEQIVSSLEEDLYPNLLSIKTIYKHKYRTYYLATESQQDMCTWVEWLCHVCGLKQEEIPTDIPEQKPPTASNGISLPAANARTASPSRPGPVTKSPSPRTVYPQGATHPNPSFDSPFDTKEQGWDSRSSSPSSYIHLDKCTTGQPVPSTDHVDSEDIPNFQAPPPPGKSSHRGEGEDDDVFLHRPPPPPRDSDAFNLYKVPPSHRSGQDEGPQESYDVPPPRRDVRLPRPISYGNQSHASSADIGETYDYPPPRLNSTTSSDGELPPDRPPTRQFRSNGTEHYANLSATVPPPPRPHDSVALSYDVPRSALRPEQRGGVPPPRPNQPLPSSSGGGGNPGSNHINSMAGLATVSPAPPKPHRPSERTAHAYLNARPLSAEVKGGSDTDTSSDRGHDLGDADRLTPPAIPPPRKDGGDGAPARPPARVAPPQASVSSMSSDGGPSDDTCVIFSTHRTRSFKKHNNINNNLPAPQLRARTLPMMSAPVPHPRPVFLSHGNSHGGSHASHARLGESGTDDEEEATHHSLSLLHSMPPPPDSDTELKYIDLALPHGGGRDDLVVVPRASHSHSHQQFHTSHMERNKGDSSTEYKEIDFVRTAALSEVKKEKEKERKSDDPN